MIYLKWWKGRTYITKNTLSSKTLIQIWWRNQKVYRQAKVKRIQQHQISFPTNTKGTSLGRKQKKKKRPTENKPKTIKKMVIWSFDNYQIIKLIIKRSLPYMIITLNVNVLNEPTKRVNWLSRWKHVQGDTVSQLYFNNIYIYILWNFKNNQKITSVGKDVEKLKPLWPLCIVGGIAKWCNHNENYLVVPKKIKYRTYTWSSKPTYICT